MKYRSFLVLVLALAGCAFSKSGGDAAQTFSQSEYGLTVDWLMEGQRQPDPTLKAIRLLNPSGETYRSDAPVTLPAAVPQSLILMGEFAQSQINQEIDFLRAVIRFGEKLVYVPAQLVAEEPLSEKRRLTFQVTGLNAAFRAEKSAQGILHIEIFAKSQRIGILEAAVRTPPSEVALEEIPIKTFESTQTQGGTSEYLKPVIAGKQINLVRVLHYTNSENLSVQIQTSRRPRGSLTQATTQIGYQQGECGFAYTNSPSDAVLGGDVIILPLDDRFITEAERMIQAPEAIGDLSTVIGAGSDASFGIYAVGDGADAWMKNGPSTNEMRTVSVIGSCGRVCIQHVCEPSPGHDHFALGGSLFGCGCEEYRRTYIPANASIGITRGAVSLNIPKEETQTPLRFADLDPHKDGEVRLLPTLTEKSEATWLQ